MIRYAIFMAAMLCLGTTTAQFSSGGSQSTSLHLGVGGSEVSDIQLKVTAGSDDHGIFSITSASEGVGVFGVNDEQDGYGIIGRSNDGIGILGLSTSGFAGKFDGDTWVTGTLEVETGIDRMAIGSAYDSDLNYGTAYLGFNAIREGGTWSLNDDGGSNGGSVIYGRINGALCFSILETTGGSPRTNVTDTQVKDNVRMILHRDGRLQVGDIAPSSTDYLLFVEKGIQTGKVKVDAAFADYVFEPGYELLTLQEVAAHIEAQGHLHNTPSAEELAAEGGFDLGEITVNQQEKIEELFLHMIALEKRVKELEGENERINKQTDEK